MRAAAIQYCSGTGIDANLAGLTPLIEKAAADGARYVLTPEMSLAFAKDREGLIDAVTADAVEEAVIRLSRLAERLKIHLHVGSFALPLNNGKFANRSVLFGPDGRAVAQYDKIHLFDADIAGDKPYRESATYEAGDEAVTARVGEFVLGFSVCYDLRFPLLYSRLAQAGANLFAAPSAFTVPTGAAHWATLVRARAIETGAFVVAAAQSGSHENGRSTFGHSMIVSPWGDVLADLGDEAEGIAVADLDPEAVAEARRRVPSLANARGFSLSVNHDPAE